MQTKICPEKVRIIGVKSAEFGPVWVHSELAPFI
jgi:hypothetical protein